MVSRAMLPARAKSGCRKSLNHSMTSSGSVSVKNRPTWPFICYPGRLVRCRVVKTIERRTLASLERPSLCSDSGVVPNALAMTAFRPKIILAVLTKNQSSDFRSFVRRRTLSIIFESSRDGCFSCFLLRITSNSAISRRLLAPTRARQHLRPPIKIG